MSEKTQKRKVLNIVIVSVQVVLILACVIFAIFMIFQSRKGDNGELATGVTLMPVLTDSMDGKHSDSFAAGDAILVEKITDETRANLKVGDIITYVGKVGDNFGYISHRIVEIGSNIDNTATIYYTAGDKQLDADYDIEAIKEPIYASAIVGVYKGQIPKLGSVITFLQNKVAFFLILILPLVALLLYNIIMIIRMAVKNKDEKHKAELAESEAKHKAEMDELKAIIMANNGAKPVDTPQPSIPIDDKEREEELKKQAIAEYLAEQERKAKEEEIKRKAIEEYLASQANNNDDK